MSGDLLNAPRSSKNIIIITGMHKLPKAILSNVRRTTAQSVGLVEYTNFIFAER